MIYKHILLILILSVLCLSCTSKHSPDSYDYVIKNHAITVDGNIDDWQSIDSISVNGEKHIWIGEGLPEGAWQGPQDLSFSVKAAHHNGELFFLFEVRDDTLSDFDQKYSWLNDCVELYLDHQNLGGDRIIGIKPGDPYKARIGKRLRGHEIHFLPADPPKVYIDDARRIYYTDSSQTEFFKKKWRGQISTRRTENDYLIEVGFAIPNFYVKAGQVMGLDIAVGDDDGAGRQALLQWSTYKGPFWLNMDHYKNVVVK